MSRMRQGSSSGGGAGQHRRLGAALGISVGLLAAEVAGGIVSGSLALLADAGHVLVDVAGLGLALLAVWVAGRPPTPARTFGYHRAEILAAAVNAAVLLGVSVVIIVESVRRLIAPPAVSSTLMLAFAGVALAGNAVAAGVLHGGRRESFAVRGAYLEVSSDLMAAAAVVVAALLILTAGFRRADAAASLLIGLVILPRTWRLLRDATDVLLEATPRNVDVAEVRRHILEVPGVIDAHDLHIWTISGGLNVISVHVVKAAAADAGHVLDCLCACLADHFDIEHSTFQIEALQHRDHEHAVHG